MIEVKVHSLKSTLYFRSAVEILKHKAIVLNFLHDTRIDGNRLIVDFFNEKRRFYQVEMLWLDYRTGL